MPVAPRDFARLRELVRTRRIMENALYTGLLRHPTAVNPLVPSSDLQRVSKDASKLMVKMAGSEHSRNEQPTYLRVLTAAPHAAYETLHSNVKLFSKNPEAWAYYAVLNYAVPFLPPEFARDVLHKSFPSVRFPGDEVPELALRLATYKYLSENFGQRPSGLYVPKKLVAATARERAPEAAMAVRKPAVGRFNQAGLAMRARLASAGQNLRTRAINYWRARMPSLSNRITQRRLVPRFA